MLLSCEFSARDEIVSKQTGLSATISCFILCPKFTLYTTLMQSFLSILYSLLIQVRRRLASWPLKPYRSPFHEELTFPSATPTGTTNLCRFTAVPATDGASTGTATKFLEHECLLLNRNRFVQCTLVNNKIKILKRVNIWQCNGQLNVACLDSGPIFSVPG